MYVIVADNGVFLSYWCDRTRAFELDLSNATRYTNEQAHTVRDTLIALGGNWLRQYTYLDMVQ